MVTQQKTLDTLVKDIYEVLEKGNVKIDTQKLADVLAKRLNREGSPKPELRMSNIGAPCERQLWYKINVPDKAEPLKGNVLLKFMVGDIVEELVLSLAEAAGHEVRGRQDDVEVSGTMGHIDGIVDDVLVDVKSASTFSFDKFRDGLTVVRDSFGYLTQLGLYSYSTRDKVGKTGHAAFIAVDKQHGHIHVDQHKFDTTRDWPSEVKAKQAMVSALEPPPRAFHPVPEGKSGNLKLGVECSYCQFKKECYPSVRTFFYAKGPVHLTHVVREPKDIPEHTYEQKEEASEKRPLPKEERKIRLSFGERSIKETT